MRILHLHQLLYHLLFLGYDPLDTIGDDMGAVVRVPPFLPFTSLTLLRRSLSVRLPAP